jgi:hypothetical protein
MLLLISLLAQVAKEDTILSFKCLFTEEFHRAVKISTGEDLSDNLVNVVFAIFDKDGDRKVNKTILFCFVNCLALAQRIHWRHVRSTKPTEQGIINFFDNIII